MLSSDWSERTKIQMGLMPYYDVLIYHAYENEIYALRKIKNEVYLIKFFYK